MTAATVACIVAMVFGMIHLGVAAAGLNHEMYHNTKCDNNCLGYCTMWDGGPNCVNGVYKVSGGRELHS